MVRRSPITLPAGRQVTVTWEIPEGFGGLTTAALQRSGWFASLGRAPVEVMTLALQPELTAVRADLRQRGLLPDGVTLVNLWADLATDPDDLLSGANFDADVTEPWPALDAAPETLMDAGRPIATVRRPVTSGLVQVDALAIGGSTVVRQHWERVGRRDPLTAFGDHVVRTEAWAVDGTFLGGWSGSWALWDLWLRHHLGDETSTVVCDSSWVGDYLSHVDEALWTTAYVVHNNHLASGSAPPLGSLAPRRRHTVEHASGFDAFVVLTNQQRTDIERLVGPIESAAVIPNARAARDKPRRRSADPLRGVTLAALIRRKRLDHAVQAVALASAELPGIHLDLWGDGSEHEALAATIGELDAPALLRGRTDGATEVLQQASFLLLTSTHEGLPLVLAEAMSAGCIPIAYDIAYGPADVIMHGVDGFLVPPGDVTALAGAIVELGRMPRRARSRMRRAAILRSRDFEPEPVVQRWAEVLATARERRASRATAPWTAADRRRDEAQARVDRFLDLTVVLSVEHVRWDGTERVHVTVECEVEHGADPDHGVDSAQAWLVDPSDGSRTPVDTVVQAVTGRRAAQVELVVDIPHRPDDLRLLVAVTSGLSTVAAIIAERSGDATSWFPEARSHRSVLLHDRVTGLRIVTALPKVAARVDADGPGLSLQAEALDGQPLDTLEAVSLDSGGGTIHASSSSGADWSLALPPVGRWKIQAVVGGRRRDVAWVGASQDLANLSLPANTRVTVTARGYLRITRSDLTSG